MAEGKKLALKRILVTGGTGLVGSAIKSIVSVEEFREDEEWIFHSICDADLTYDLFICDISYVCYILHCVHSFIPALFLI